VPELRQTARGQPVFLGPGGLQRASATGRPGPSLGEPAVMAVAVKAAAATLMSEAVPAVALKRETIASAPVVKTKPAAALATTSRSSPSLGEPGVTAAAFKGEAANTTTLKSEAVPAGARRLDRHQY
jgi:hypothetical protein